jgi:biopolymer transport protein ExbD
VRVESGFESKRPRIEMIALIDVVFLLLVFFIYAMLSMTVFRGLDVTLPRAEGEVRAEALVVTLDRDNHFLVNERIMTVDQAAAWAVAEHGRSGRPVLIRGDRQADLGVALELLEALQKAGLEGVLFQVEGTP